MTEREAMSAGLHEAAHFIIAAHWAHPARPEITPEGFSTVESRAYNGIGGLCHFARIRKPLRLAILSWAGMLAQCMAGVGPEWAPPFVPKVRNLRDWHSMALHQLGRFSDGDRAGILGCSRLSFRACKTAFKILWRNRARLKWLAEVQLAAVRPQLEATAKSGTLAASATPAITPQGWRWRGELLQGQLDAPCNQQHPDRGKWLAVLEFLLRGEEPPADLIPDQETSSNE